AILATISWWTISRPGREFQHYLYFGVLPAFAGMLAPFAFARREEEKSGFATQAITIAIACFVLIAYVSDLGRTRLAMNAKQFVQGNLWIAGRLRDGLFPQGSTWLSWVLPTDASLFVWGWAAEWYVLANGYPATRNTAAAGFTAERYVLANGDPATRDTAAA